VALDLETFVMFFRVRGNAHLGKNVASTATNENGSSRSRVTEPNQTQNTADQLYFCIQTFDKTTTTYNTTTL
jgi:hypothetical protein